MSQYILVYILSVLVAVCVCVYSKRIVVYVTCIDKLVYTRCNIVSCKQLFTFYSLKLTLKLTAQSLNLRLAKTVVLLLMVMAFK